VDVDASRPVHLFSETLHIPICLNCKDVYIHSIHTLKSCASDRVQPQVKMWLSNFGLHETLGNVSHGHWKVVDLRDGYDPGFIFSQFERDIALLFKLSWGVK